MVPFSQNLPSVKSPTFCESRILVTQEAAGCWYCHYLQNVEIVDEWCRTSTGTFRLRRMKLTLADTLRVLSDHIKNTIKKHWNEDSTPHIHGNNAGRLECRYNPRTAGALPGICNNCNSNWEPQLFTECIPEGGGLGGGNNPANIIMHGRLSQPNTAEYYNPLPSTFQCLKAYNCISWSRQA